MENDLILKKGLFGYNRKEVKEYIARLSAGFEERLEAQENGYKSLLAELENDRDDMEKKYSSLVADLRQENDNLISSLENLLDNSSSIEPPVSSVHEESKLSDSEFRSVCNAIAMSDESFDTKTAAADISKEELTDRPSLSVERTEKILSCLQEISEILKGESEQKM